MEAINVVTQYKNGHYDTSIHKYPTAAVRVLCYWERTNNHNNNNSAVVKPEEDSHLCSGQKKSHNNIHTLRRPPSSQSLDTRHSCRQSFSLPGYHYQNDMAHTITSTDDDDDDDNDANSFQYLYLLLLLLLQGS